METRCDWSTDDDDEAAVCFRDRFTFKVKITFDQLCSCFYLNYNMRCENMANVTQKGEPTESVHRWRRRPTRHRDEWRRVEEEALSAVNDSRNLNRDEARFQIQVQCASVTAEGVLECTVCFSHILVWMFLFGNPMIGIHRGPEKPQIQGRVRLKFHFHLWQHKKDAALGPTRAFTCSLISNVLDKAGKADLRALWNRVHSLTAESLKWDHTSASSRWLDTV